MLQIQEISAYRAATGEILPWKLAMWGCFRDGKLLEKVTRQFSIFRDFSKAHGLIAHQGFELRENKAQSREQLETEPE